MSEVPPLNPNVTPVLGIPLLTEQDKQSLIEDTDHGITPPSGVRRYSTFERWQETGTAFQKNNYVLHFMSGFTGDLKRELPWIQRFAFLYPDLLQQLEEITEPKIKQEGIPVVTEDEERLYWEAYEKIADLIDVNDPYITNDQDLPEGQAFPGVLTG